MAQSMGGREWALLVALSILWGGSFFFFEIALRDFGPLTIVFGRVGLAALWLYGFLRLSRASMPGDLATWRQFAAMGYTGAANLLLVTLLVPPSALVLGVVVLGERPSVNVFIGLALIFAGLITIDGRLVRRVATFLAGSSAPRG